MLLVPFMLAPLGSLLTPGVARADYSYWIPVQKCDFKGGHWTPWSVEITVHSKDNSAKVTRLQIGNGGNDEKIRQLQLREYSYGDIKLERTYAFNPPITQWDKKIDSPWIKSGGDRSVTLWLYREDTRTCQDKVKF
jgi:hypothetical protein